MVWWNYSIIILTAVERVKKFPFYLKIFWKYKGIFFVYPSLKKQCRYNLKVPTYRVTSNAMLWIWHWLSKFPFKTSQFHNWIFSFCIICTAYISHYTAKKMSWIGIFLPFLATIFSFLLKFKKFWTLWKNVSFMILFKNMQNHFYF